MAVRLRKPAIKFLRKVNPEEVARIQGQLTTLVNAVEQGVIPFTELDIKKMRGDWAGFYRLRIGSIRIIFAVDLTSGDVDIYAIGSRGDIYK